MTYEQNRRDLAEKMAKEYYDNLGLGKWDTVVKDGMDSMIISHFIPLADIALHFAAEQAEKAYASLTTIDKHLIAHGLKQ